MKYIELIMNMKHLLTYTAVTIMCLTSQISFAQGLLGKLDLEEIDTASEIFDSVMKPIAMFDPEFVEVKVLDDLEIFKGHSDDIFPPSWLNTYQDNPMLFQLLHAQDNELLLKVNVQVNLKEAFYENIHTTLSRLADTERLMNGTSSEKMKRSGDTNVGFLVGSIKGTPRVHYVVNKDAERAGENPYMIHQFMGLLNQDVQSSNSNNVHKLFTYYGFSRSHNSGMLCKNLAYDYARTTKEKKVYDQYTEDVRPAAQDYFTDIYPVINIKFLDSDNSVVNEDTITKQNGQHRPLSIAGFNSAESLGINRDAYQSVVTIDSKNGWHPQDAVDDQSPNQLRFSKLINMMHMRVYFGANPLAGCSFGITKQTNFSIITKVTKEILGKTEKIVVEFEPETDKHTLMWNKIQQSRWK